MKLRSAAALLFVSASSAHAAWFCGSEPEEFAANRSMREVGTVIVYPEQITAGQYHSSGVLWTCSTDSAGNNNCHADWPTAETPKPYTPDELSAEVDAYEAKVNAIDDWAGSLQDGCLRDAYRAAMKFHHKRIEKDRRAIEFMKSPAPLAPNS